MSEVLFILVGVLGGGVGGYLLKAWVFSPVIPPCLNPHLSSVPPEILARTKVLVTQQEAEGGNGELKRHRAYARLLKEFPQVPRRQLAVAIEAAHEALP